MCDHHRWRQGHRLSSPTAPPSPTFVTYSRRQSHVWLANYCFAHISLGFPFLLRFCDEQSGHSFYSFHCYPGPLARSWRRPFQGCGTLIFTAPPVLSSDTLPNSICVARSMSAAVATAFSLVDDARESDSLTYYQDVFSFSRVLEVAGFNEIGRGEWI